MSTVEAYKAVNALWPVELPKLDGAEAIKAARMLLRVGLEAAPERVRNRRWRFRLTSGNRYTAPAGDVFFINPDRYGRGWHSLVHSLSHYCHGRVYPGKRGHEGHAVMEMRLIQEVLDRGWLDGRLKSAPKVRPARNVKAERAAKVEASLKRWEAKRRRAETAIKKLMRQRAYYSKAIAS